VANILIVDDQPSIGQLMTAELTLEGHHVTSVDNAESVRTRVLSFQPDLVLLDLYLEGPQGFALLEDIKRKYPQLPVLIYTAYDSYQEDRRLSRADGYVIKSVDLGELKVKIAEILRGKRSEGIRPAEASPCSDFE
jgi:DNA-binding response OmpR family regulator